jgi:hypothetical protein
MLTVEEFFSTECADTAAFARDLKKRIAAAYSQGEKKFNYSGNVYDLEIDFEKNSVLIIENLYEETKEKIMAGLDEFDKKLQQKIV